MEEIDFASLPVSVSPDITKYPLDLQRNAFDYLRQLDDINQIAYTVAFTQLGSSFNVVRSNGFKQWMASKQQT